MTGGGGSGAVVCVNGGQGRPEEGTWSVTREWLVRRLASLFPRVASGEVRYRIKSWSWMDWCEEVRGRPSRSSARGARYF